MSSLGDWIPEDIPEAIMDDAARWMALLDSEQCNEADRLSFAIWLDEDPQHRWAFQELSEVWARLRTLADVKPLLDQPVVSRLPSVRPAKPPGAVQAMERHRDWSALAASVLVALGFLVHLALGTPTERFSTGTGEVRDVTLADGSTVELNARTTMDVEMDREGRRVRLAAGDAVFHVAKGARPFVVSTDHGSVAALGTSFAVEQEGGGMEVSVLEGRVSVTAASAEMPLTEYDGKVDFTPRSGATVLDPGQRLDLTAEHQQPESVAPEELNRELAWRGGYVVYDDQPLGSIVGDMRRYSKVNIHLADERLNDIRISGRFAIGDISGLLAQLSNQDGVFVDQAGPRWVVLRRQAGRRLN
jgi:transmembrane sensor